MRKIPTLFLRDPENRQFVLPEVNPVCEWVLKGEGIPHRKIDGTCVLRDSNGAWWARREVKPGKKAPNNYLPIETDPVTGKTVGWEPIEQSAFAKFHAEAVADAGDADYPEGVNPGTYELIGPKINGNPERCEVHELVAHEHTNAIYLPIRDFDTIRECVLRLHRESGMEGIVFHHGDGRMAKIKARDFRRDES